MRGESGKSYAPGFACHPAGGGGTETCIAHCSTPWKSFGSKVEEQGHPGKTITSGSSLIHVLTSEVPICICLFCTLLGTRL